MEGTSFAIPINRVREIMNDLSQGKEIRHGYLGISLATCTPEWAQKNNAVPETPQIPEVRGALVYKVFPMTPAARGGLKPNDVILQVNGKKVMSADDTRKLIDAAPIGKVSPSLRSSPSLHSPLCTRISRWLCNAVSTNSEFSSNLWTWLLD